MATLSQMTAYIAKRLLDPSFAAVTEEQVTEAINQSIEYWKFRRFWFNERVFTDTLTAQDSEMPYPSDFLVPATKDDGFYVEYSGIRYPLAKISQQVFDSNYLTTGYGLPRWYARIPEGGEDGYQCYPIPDRAYTIKCHYLRQYDELSGSGDENDFTTYGARLIQLWTLASLQSEIRQDEKMGQYYRDAAQDEYRQLQVMTNKANSSGKLTLHSTLTNYF